MKIMRKKMFQMNNKVSDIFKITYGTNLELNLLEKCGDGINFVSRTSKNNGVSAKVKPLIDIEPIPAGTISVAVGGSVMESYLQTESYYCGRDIIYLKPKVEMSAKELLYYCMCLRANKYRYSYGRQANSTLPDLIIPSIHQVKKTLKLFSLEKYRKQMLADIEFPCENIKHKKSNKNVMLKNLFDIKNGITSNNVLRHFNKKQHEDYVAYLRPSYKQETSIDAYLLKKEIEDKSYIFAPYTIYVSTDGQGSHTYSYVSIFDFVPNSNISTLIPKRKMSLAEKLYYAMCISSNRYKFSYGRKPKGDRLENILLPEFPPKWVDSKIIKRIIEKWENS